MPKHKPHPITQDEYDNAIDNAYTLGYQMGQIEERNRHSANPIGTALDDQGTLWLGDNPPIARTFVEKQAEAILVCEDFGDESHSGGQ